MSNTNCDKVYVSFFVRSGKRKAALVRGGQTTYIEIDEEKMLKAIARKEAKEC